MSLRVPVTQEDIDNGKMGDAMQCPIAQAVRRVSGAIYATVTYWNIFLYDDEFREIARYRANNPAFKFIMDFDGGKPVEPHTFILKEAGEGKYE